MNLEESTRYFSPCEIGSCPQCVEAKILANKLYNQLGNTLDRITEHAMTADPGVDPTGYTRKADGLQLKFEKIQREFIAILRGRTKCCVPVRFLTDYQQAWSLQQHDSIPINNQQPGVARDIQQTSL